MPVNRRWIRRVIETAKSASTPMPWTLARAARSAAPDRAPVIRTTLQPKTR